MPESEDGDSPHQPLIRWHHLSFLIPVAAPTAADAATQSDLLSMVPLEGVLGAAVLLALMFVFTMAGAAVRQYRMMRARRSPNTDEKLLRLMGDSDRVAGSLDLGRLVALAFSLLLWIDGVHALTPASWGSGWVVTILGVVWLTPAMGIGTALARSIGVRSAEQVLLALYHPIRLWNQICYPVTQPALWLGRRVGSPFHLPVEYDPPVISPTGIVDLAEVGEEMGVLEQEETEMIRSVLEFPDTVVRKVMTPRTDMTCISESATIDEVLTQVSQSGHSRIPVYEQTVDSIVGILYAKDILGCYHREEAPFHLRDVVREPYFIPETKKVGELLKEFRRTKLQIAIVRDEYGGTSGLVTLEDLIEELVGEIQDEYDPEEPELLYAQEDGYVADGKLPLEDLNELLDIRLPLDEYDTIGGLVFGLIGHSPSEGDEVVYNGLRCRVLRTDGSRIQSIYLQKVNTERTAEPLPDTGSNDLRAK